MPASSTGAKGDRHWRDEGLEAFERTAEPPAEAKPERMEAEPIAVPARSASHRPGAIVAAVVLVVLAAMAGSYLLWWPVGVTSEAPRPEAVAGEAAPRLPSNPVVWNLDTVRPEGRATTGEPSRTGAPPMGAPAPAPAVTPDPPVNSDPPKERPARAEAPTPRAVPPSDRRTPSPRRGPDYFSNVMGEPASVTWSALPDTGVAASAPPAVAPPTPVSPSDSRPAVSSDRAAIGRLIAAYERAYDARDLEAVTALWPSVDASRFARAFSSVKSQDLTFATCEITLGADSAIAECPGLVRFVRQVGGSTPQMQHAMWSIKLARAADRWHVTDIVVR